jgi:hypothetical protein
LAMRWLSATSACLPVEHRMPARIYPDLALEVPATDLRDWHRHARRCLSPLSVVAVEGDRPVSSSEAFRFSARPTRSR